MRTRAECREVTVEVGAAEATLAMEAESPMRGWYHAQCKMSTSLKRGAPCADLSFDEMFYSSGAQGTSNTTRWSPLGRKPVARISPRSLMLKESSSVTVEPGMRSDCRSAIEPFFQTNAPVEAELQRSREMEVTPRKDCPTISPSSLMCLAVAHCAPFGSPRSVITPFFQRKGW